jgi:hypothetical protein
VKGVAVTLACAVLLASCAPVSTSAIAVSQTDTEARALAWAGITARAARQVGFAGTERTSDFLYIGYTNSPERRLAELTNRPDVRAFLAPRTLAELDAALTTATQMLVARAVPYVGLAKDYRRGAIVVTDVENTQKVGSFYCDQLVPLPQRVEGTTVAMIDDRVCSKR